MWMVVAFLATCALLISLALWVKGDVTATISCGFGSFKLEAKERKSPPAPEDPKETLHKFCILMPID
jgi:hypothetical protein